MYKLSRVLKAIFWFFLGSPTQKRRVRQELARMSAAMFGDFPLSEDHKLWREDKVFLQAYKRLSPGNPYSEDRKYVLREFVRFTKNVPGCIAECGSYQGATAFFMAEEAPDTPLHLFDSFEGLSDPSPEDNFSGKDQSFWQRGDLTSPEEVVHKTLAQFSNVVYHKGWIPEKFPEVEGLKFRLLHIDVDLFQPTLDSLEFFYARLNSGGVIVMDDYGLATCPGAHKAAEEFMRDKPEYILHLPTGQGVIIKQSS